MKTIMVIHQNPLSTFLLTIAVGTGVAAFAAKMLGLI